MARIQNKGDQSNQVSLIRRGEHVGQTITPACQEVRGGQERQDGTSHACDAICSRGVGSFTVPQGLRQQTGDASSSRRAEEAETLFEP